ncbi:MAG: helix-turn-helix transcriptional regulator [Bacteroidota bacterium]
MAKEVIYYEHLGAILKAYRCFRKIKAVEIATILGVSVQQLHKYEKGKDRIPIDKLERYSNRIDVCVEEILDWSKKIKTIS